MKTILPIHHSWILEVKAASRLSTTSTSQPPAKPTAGLYAMDLFCYLDWTAFTAHLRLWWWPCIDGTLSHNNGSAVINAVEHAGDTSCSLNFGDTEAVVCKRVKNVRIYDVWGSELQKTLIFTDCLYGIVGWEKLGERSNFGANEDDFDCGATSSEKSWGGVGDGGKKGSCWNGEDLHVVWSWPSLGVFWEGCFGLFMWEGLCGMRGMFKYWKRCWWDGVIGGSTGAF